MFSIMPFQAGGAALGSGVAPVGSPGIAQAPGNGQVDIGPLGRAGLMAAGLIPGVGMLASLGSLGLRGYNTMGLQGIANQEGLPGLSGLQTLGGFLGLNGYGSGSNASLMGMLANNGVNANNATSLPHNPNNLALPGDYFSQLSNNGLGGMGYGSNTQAGGGFSPGAASGDDAG